VISARVQFHRVVGAPKHPAFWRIDCIISGDPVSMRLLSSLYDEVRALSIHVKATPFGRAAPRRRRDVPSSVAAVHATAAMLEEYCFQRLSPIESTALELHLIVCVECACRLQHRKRFLAVLKAALSLRREARPQGVSGVFAFDEQSGETTEVSVSVLPRG
jgi:hypothetical protein